MALIPKKYSEYRWYHWLLIIIAALAIFIIFVAEPDSKKDSGPKSTQPESRGSSSPSSAASVLEDPRNVYLYCISRSPICFLTPAECESALRFHTDATCQPVACGTSWTHSNTGLCDKQFKRR